eukprot:2736903-Amphidinium_carterae.1
MPVLVLRFRFSDYRLPAACSSDYIDYLQPAVVRELRSSLRLRLLRFSVYRLPAACSSERTSFIPDTPTAL